MEKLYFCDHQTAFQSFPLHLTAFTNCLCPLQWHWVLPDSIWIAFHPWKTLFHWSQTPSTHGKVVFLSPPDSLSVIPTASTHGYKLPEPTAMAQSVDWLHLDNFSAIENSLPLTTNAFHTWKVVFLFPFTEICSLRDGLREGSVGE